MKTLNLTILIILVIICGFLFQRAIDLGNRERGITINK